MSHLQQYLDLYHANHELLAAHSTLPLNRPRAEAAAFLANHPLPNKRDERYKYIDTDAAFAPDFGINLHRALAIRNPYSNCHCSVPEMNTFVVYVVNDVVYPISPTCTLPEGVTILPLNQAAQQCPELVEQYYHKAAAQEPANAHKHQQRTDRDVITQLNTLLVQDGLFVHLAPGVRLEGALQVVFLSSARHDLMSNRRMLVVAEADAQADILFCEHADAGRKFLTTQVTEVFAHERAQLNFYALEETQPDNARFSNIYIEQQADSRVTYNSIALITGVSRTMINARLLGKGADCQTSGAVIADVHQLVDNNIFVDHVAEACTSDMLYKYVLNGESEAAFSGKVMVRPGAQHTLSHQNSANLCVSPNAKVHSQPMLEIYADDVRCNHGSTIGKLDETALLYLRQRGIPDAEARLLLQHAFVNDVLQRVHIEALRERLSHLIEMRFRGEQRRCQNCK